MDEPSGPALGRPVCLGHPWCPSWIVKVVKIEALIDRPGTAEMDATYCGAHDVAVSCRRTGQYQATPWAVLIADRSVILPCFSVISAS